MRLSYNQKIRLARANNVRLFVPVSHKEKRKERRTMRRRIVKWIDANQVKAGLLFVSLLSPAIVSCEEPKCVGARYDRNSFLYCNDKLQIGTLKTPEYGFYFVYPVEKKTSIVRDAIPLYGTAALEIVSTEYGIKHGLGELNWLAQNPARRIGIKAAGNTGILLIVHRLRTTGRVWQANVVKWTTTILQFGLSVYNYNLTRKQIAKQEGR